jgi:putative transposase
MPEYHRSLIPGGTFFFTVVTHQRMPILILPGARTILHNAWISVYRRFPFTTEAICLLPDHIHCIWTLPEGDSNYTLRWSEIKKGFTGAYHQQFGRLQTSNASRLKRGEASIWQRRYWEHLIQDMDDFQRHVKYIHYNPVKHGLVDSTANWRWSSFHKYVRLGLYDHDWGSEFKDDKSNGFGE